MSSIEKYDELLATLVDNGNFDAAAREISAIWDRFEFSKIGINRALLFCQLLMKVDNLQLALSIAQRVIDEDDRDYRPVEVIFWVMFKSRQYSDAEIALTKLVNALGQDKQGRYRSYLCWKVILSNVLSRHEVVINIWDQDLNRDPMALTERHDEVFYAVVSAYIAFDRLIDARHTVDTFAGMISGKELNALMVLSYLNRMEGNYDKAIELYDEAANLYPSNKDVIWNRALTLLGAGNVTRGFSDYEIRWDWPDFPSPKRKFNQKRGTPQDKFFNKNVLIWGEQGLGDEIMFLSCLPYFLSVARCASVVLEVNPKLVGIYERIYPELVVREHGPLDSSGIEYEEFDFQIPVGSLPRFLGEKIFDESEKCQRYLSFAVAEKQDVLGEFYRKFSVNIGLCWRSHHLSNSRVGFYLGLGAVEAILRSIPEDVGVIICQYSLSDNERARLREYPNVFVPEEDLFTDVYTNALYVSCCDFVLTAGTNVNYLSGLTGVPSMSWGPRDAWSTLGQDRIPWFPTMGAVFCDSGWDKGSLVLNLKRGLKGVISRLQNYKP